MRGKVYIYITYTHFTRITPAYAGKSPLSGGVGASLRDHPRLCGEKAADTYHPHYHVGSPPPMRGKEAVCGGIKDFLRITPAYAGKRSGVEPLR